MAKGGRCEKVKEWAYVRMSSMVKIKVYRKIIIAQTMR